MAVPVLFAKIEADGRIGSQGLTHFADNQSRVFMISKVGCILLDELVVFCPGIAGKSGYAVRIVNRFKDVGNFIDCDAAGNSVNDILGI